MVEKCSKSREGHGLTLSYGGRCHLAGVWTNCKGAFVELVDTKGLVQIHKDILQKELRRSHSKEQTSCTATFEAWSPQKGFKKKEGYTGVVNPNNQKEKVAVEWKPPDGNPRGLFAKGSRETK